MSQVPSGTDEKEIYYLLKNTKLKFKNTYFAATLADDKMYIPRRDDKEIRLIRIQIL